MPVYVVDKPLHLSSHDVVARARRLLGTRKVGHGGTLDPLASGVLALLMGDDTKISPFLTGSRKRYLAWVCFGAMTPTLDAEGPVVAEHLPADLDRARIEQALPEFLALREQLPPDFSAIKLGGVKGYEAARRGERLDLPARPARYFEVTLLSFAPCLAQLPSRIRSAGGVWVPAEEEGTSGPAEQRKASGPAKERREAPLPEPLGDYPSALIRLEVDAGTYIRAFARDLGDALGTGAYLGGLLRTGAGTLDLSQAVPLDQLANATPLPAVAALPFPRVELSEAEAERVRKGQRLPLALAGRTSLLDPRGELVAIAESQEGRMKLLRVWSQGRG